MSTALGSFQQSTLGSFTQSALGVRNQLSGSVAMLVAVGNSADMQNIMTSLDGASWVLRTTPTGWVGYACCYSPILGRYVAVGDGSTSDVLYSDNGTTWTEGVDNAPAGTIFRGVTWSANLNLFIAAGDISGTDVDNVFTSPTGATWTRRTTGVYNNVFGVCVTTGATQNVIVTGTDTSGTTDAMTSPDALTWTKRTTPAEFLTGDAVCFAAEMLPSPMVVAVGNGTGFKQAWTSTNFGLTWTAQNTPALAGLRYRGVAWSPTLLRLVAVGPPSSSTGTAAIITSDNGSLWTARAHPTFTIIYAVCWSASLAKFIAVGDGSVSLDVTTSPDGVTWTAQTAAANGSWQGVCASG